MPRLVCGSRKLASVLARMKSVQQHIRQPTPIAKPLTAAITGFV